MSCVLFHRRMFSLYPRYKDEILSINRNITLKNRGKNIIDFLNKHIGNKININAHNYVIFHFSKKEVYIRKECVKMVQKNVSSVIFSQPLKRKRSVYCSN